MINMFDSYKCFKCLSDLVKQRKGCVICMDYSRYSIMDYGRLVRVFEPIVVVLTEKLYQLESQGFAANQSYIFGFSYGAQLALEAGKRFGRNKIQNIDGNFNYKYNNFN